MLTCILINYFGFLKCDVHLEIMEKGLYLSLHYHHFYFLRAQHREYHHLSLFEKEAVIILVMFAIEFLKVFASLLAVGLMDLGIQGGNLLLRL